MVKAFKPPIQFKEEFDTKIEKLSFIQGVISHGVRITELKTAVNGTAIIYTVPKGKVFYLVSLSLTIGNTAAIAAHSTNSIRIDGVGELIVVKNGIADEENTSASLSFPIPIKVVAGEKICVNSNKASVFADGTIIGYEVDIALIPNFI